MITSSDRKSRSGALLPPPRVPRRRRIIESVVEGLLFFSAVSAVFITVAIVYVLLSESDRKSVV